MTCYDMYFRLIMDFTSHRNILTHSYSLRRWQKYIDSLTDVFIFLPVSQGYHFFEIRFCIYIRLFLLIVHLFQNSVFWSSFNRYGGSLPLKEWIISILFLAHSHLQRDETKWFDLCLEFVFKSKLSSMSTRDAHSIERTIGYGIPRLFPRSNRENLWEECLPCVLMLPIYFRWIQFSHYLLSFFLTFLLLSSL